ncbi:hypothetical protein GOBAR_DD13409 [Gossypium barbadense]|nr:hypothetical protein GOBAR_DD13409 [Gossypium barbadense]
MTVKDARWLAITLEPVQLKIHQYLSEQPGRRGQRMIKKPQSRLTITSSIALATPKFVASSTPTSSATSLIPEPPQLVASSRFVQPSSSSH